VIPWSHDDDDYVMPAAKPVLDISLVLGVIILALCVARSLL
jgi:hypothetical protein